MVSFSAKVDDVAKYDWELSRGTVGSNIKSIGKLAWDVFWLVIVSAILFWLGASLFPLTGGLSGLVWLLIPYVWVVYGVGAVR